MTCAALLAGPPVGAAELPGPQAAREVEVVADLITRTHPALHRYDPRSAWTSRLDSEVDTLRAQSVVDELRLGLSLHRLLAPVGDAHIAVGLPLYSSDDVELLPVFPRTVAEGVLFDAALPGVPPDALLLAIDGVEVDALYRELGALVMADGRDPTAVRAALEHDLPRFHALQFGLRPDHTLRVRAGAEERTITVDSLDREALRALRAGRHTLRAALAWGAEHGASPPHPSVGPLPHGGAILRVPTFGAADMAAFALEIGALFDHIDPAAPLLIDVRGNEGGLRPNAHAVLDRLVAGPAPEWTDMVVRVRRDPTVVEGELRWPAGSPDERLRDAPFRRQGGRWWWEGDPLQDRPPFPGVLHTGPVLVLVDGRTGSAANGFVQSLRAARPDVRVVGESLGGACDRHIGELPLVWVGPHSGVAVLFSLIDIGHVQPPGCLPGRGQPPDVPIGLTAADVLGERDVWMEAALALLGGP